MTTTIVSAIVHRLVVWMGEVLDEPEATPEEQRRIAQARSTLCRNVSWW